MTALLIAAGVVLLILYPVTFYPLLLLLFSRRRAARREEARPASLTVVLPVRNEESDIVPRVEDILRQGDPRLVEVLIVSDASSDSTEERVRRIDDERVRLLRVEGSRGKTACQQAGIASARGEIVVLTDCGARWDPGTLTALADAFADPAVGCASGRAVYTGARTVEERGPFVRGWSVLWDIEHMLRRLESSAGALTGLTGFVCAVRRVGAPQLADDWFDDWTLAAATVAAGKRSVYVPGAVGRKAASGSLREDFLRRRRNAVITLHTLLRTAHLWCRPQRPLFALEVFSHKVLRYLTPFLLAALGLTAAWGLLTAPEGALRTGWILLAALGAAAILLSLAGLGLGARGVRTPLWIPGYWLFLQFVVLSGWWSLVRRGSIRGWTPQRVGAPAIPGGGPTGE